MSDDEGRRSMKDGNQETSSQPSPRFRLSLVQIASRNQAFSSDC